jgi:hypothetical protein
LNGGRVEFRFKHSTSNFKETAAFVDVLGAFIKATISERGIWNQIQNSTRLQKPFVSPVDYDEYKQYGDDAAVITPDVMRDMFELLKKVVTPYMNTTSVIKPP